MKRSIVAVAGLLVAAAAWGAEQPGSDTVGQWYLSPEAGGTFVDGDRGVDHALFYGLAAGRHLTEDWSAEINLISGRHDGRHGSPDLRISALSADLLRVFDRDSRVSPFLTFGLGAIRDARSGSPSEDSLLAQVGGGALIHAWTSESGSSSFSLRPFAKLRFDDVGGGHDHALDTLVGIGFEFAFGAPHAQPAAAAPPAAPPPPPPVAATLPAKPAVLDSDGDGVPDDRDRCPDTPRGTAVDAQGCPLKGSITLVGVHFATNSARLTSDSNAVLAPLAAELKAHSRLRIEVQGHTDSVGAAAYNLKLSNARANAVRDYLIEQGVAASELTAKGYGETRPVADNRTAAGRAQNRRVVLQVLDNPGDVRIKRAADTD